MFARARSPDPVVTATAGVLAGIGVLHVVWGLQVPWPAPDAATLAATVVGSDTVPPPAACFAVAGALGVASALVAGVPVGPRWFRRLGQTGVAVVLGTRGLLGLAGRTDLVAPDSTDARFRRLDRRVYSPLCLALAAGAAHAARSSKV